MTLGNSTRGGFVVHLLANYKRKLCDNKFSRDLCHVRKVMSYAGTMSQNLRGDNAFSKKPFTVFVEGNIGSGKTTFLNNFNHSEAQIISEPIDLWRNAYGHNLLATLYEDPKRWGFLFQSYVQLTMLDLHTSPSQQSLKLMERSIHSARLCFVENLYRSKTISDSEMTVLDQWYKWIKSHIDVDGDLVVYLQTKPEVVYERMRARNRKEENCVPLSYLQQLHDLHEEWLIQGSHISRPSQIIVVNANQDLSEMKEEFSKIKDTIIDQLSRQIRSVSI